MQGDPEIQPRQRRLAEELVESGFTPPEAPDQWDRLLAEVDYALRPRVHERRVPTYGAIVDPTTDPADWAEGADLPMTRRTGRAYPLAGARLFADGMSSWLVRRSDEVLELLVFDRPAGSERDLVVLSEVTGGTLVQRHPRGWIRVVGTFGVLRWDGISWHHEPHLNDWFDAFGGEGGLGGEPVAGSRSPAGDDRILEELLEFAVHDLGSRNIGALLVYQPDGDDVATFEARLPTPPPLRISHPSDLAPLVHVLGQIDGAVFFDGAGTLRELGVRLVPTPGAESDVDPYRGMRHTSARRYSFDDPESTVIVVSEDGPVTVFRNGELIATSRPSR